MTHETGGVPDRPGGDAESALESAACHLRASPRPAGASPSRERELLRGRQARDLFAWARENDCLIEPASYRGLVEDCGQEHRVWLDEQRQRYFKATFPGRFGFSVTVVPGAEPGLVWATPLEYLERLLLHNAIFGDEIRLEGIGGEDDGLAVVSSQPNIKGGPVLPADIIGFFARLWFRPLAGLHLGNPGALAFYRDLDELAVFDAHPANFVQDTHGVVLPIDLILVRADAALQAAIEPFLAQA